MQKAVPTWIVLLATASAGFTAACSPVEESTPIPSVEDRAAQLLDLASPAPKVSDLTALSEELLVHEAAGGMNSGARLLQLAADLRARAFRIGRNRADARAALSLYTEAAKMGGSERCQAAWRGLRLSAELEHSPGLLHRGAHELMDEFADSDCAREIEEALRWLAAWHQGDDAASVLLAKAPAQVENEAAEAVVKPMQATEMAEAPARATASSVQVLRIDPYGSRDRARIVVTLSAPAKFDSGSLIEEPNAKPRIELDIEGAEASSRAIEVGGIVERVRKAPNGENARLTIELSAKASHRVFFLPEPFRLVVDISTESPRELPRPEGAPRPVRRVALDPGHGGTDPGAVGPSGLREKDVALDIAHRAAPILARELGILTLLTRDDDRYVPLAERTARANAFHADLFISIHCNAAETSNARGVATFVFDRTRDQAAAKLAARENATTLAASLEFADTNQALEPIELSKRSRHLAGLLDRTTMASLLPRWSDTSSHGVKAAGFFVLVGAEMPSVLFETSFISNPIEEERLATPAYRQKLADAIVNAVQAYREGR